ncbi:MAG TPA: aldolase [Planctomycetota bacterium]|jgi:class I fructose-bisphosphate aldolase
MSIGKQVHLNRLFSHKSGRLAAVAIDHFINYGLGLPEGLRDIRRTLAQIAEGKPDSITLHRGVAKSAYSDLAGRIPFILQSSLTRPDDSGDEIIATPEDAAQMGADGFAVAAFVRGQTEIQHLKKVAHCVEMGERCGMPVFVHIYPREFTVDGVKISFKPEEIAWATRCAWECGVDVVKVPYCGDLAAYTQIVRECPVPVVAAGGPQTKTLDEALRMLADVVKSGASGAVVGRNIWGVPNITDAVLRMKEIVHGD